MGFRLDRLALASVAVVGGWVWLALAAVGCESSDPRARGAAGESCQARADCAEQLACLDNQCLPVGTPEALDTDAGASAQVSDARGGPGESCTRRADCRSGLSCIAQVCVEGGVSPATEPHSTLGDRGESCQARNDCAAGLACIMNRCVTRDANTTSLEPKQCFRVQCELSEDCCERFVAPLNCPGWKSACGAGDMAACASYDASCVCNMQCRNSICQPVRTCSADSECAALSQRCFAGQCAQCQADSDCPMAQQRCIDAVCRAGCDRPEQCPLFHECRGSECVEVGCKSDRECHFATKNALARCVETECVQPCQSDAQCPELQVCEAERCRFVGCQTHEECRVFLNVASQAGPDRAVCRLPDR
jgi:hypothetical protein